MSKHDDLVDALKTNDSVKLKQVLAKHPELPNCPDWTPSPLHCTVLWNKPQMAKLLLDHGADIELKDPDRQTTPLRYAIVYGKKEMIRLLISLGANTGPIVEQGTSALEMAKEAAEGSLEEFSDLPSRDEYSKIVALLQQLGVE